MDIKNTAWFTRARLKAASLKSEADGAGETLRRFSADIDDVRARITNLELQLADLEQQRGFAKNIVPIDAKHERLRQLHEAITPVKIELEALRVGRVDLENWQQTAITTAGEKVRFKEGTARVMEHIGGHVPGAVVGGA